MKLGALCFLSDESISPAELGRLMEDRALESLWLPEHTHIPASRLSAHPAGIELPRAYPRMLDPFVALATVAAGTARLRLGFGVCLAAQRDPILTAKAVATLDHLSDGRVLFGVGAGWNREEMANHGVDPRRRFAILAEHVSAIRTIWSEAEASFRGEHVEFERIWSWPKPRQRPGPPILVGGEGPGALDRVLAYGDGWMPNPAPGADDLVRRAAELLRRAGQEGRPAPSLTLFTAPRDPDRLRRYAEAGFERAVCLLPTAGRERLEPMLDGLGELAGQIG